MKSLNITKHDLKGVKGKIHTMGEVVILPFTTTVDMGIVNLMTHSKCMNIVVKPVTGYSDHIAKVRSCGVLRPGRGKNDVCIRNHSAKQITLPEQTAAVNVIPALLVPNPTEDESAKGESTTQKGKCESHNELLDKIDFPGLRDWSFDEQKEVQDLITEYTSIFLL